jgi:hypothetical protein
VQNKHHFTIEGITPKNDSIFNYGMKICKINSFGAVIAADMRLRLIA